MPAAVREAPPAAVCGHRTRKGFLGGPGMCGPVGCVARQPGRLKQAHANPVNGFF